MSNIWQWAVVTNRGIYSGETQGTMEPGETQEEAMQIVELSAVGFIRATHPDDILVCCFVALDILSIMPLMEMHGLDVVVTGIVSLTSVEDRKVDDRGCN